MGPMSGTVRIAMLVVLLLPGAAHAADPISQFHLAANGSVTTKISVKAGQVYPMEITGTRTFDNSAVHPGDRQLADAFWCFQSAARDESSPPGRPQPPSSATIHAQTGSGVALP